MLRHDRSRQGRVRAFGSRFHIPAAGWKFTARATEPALAIFLHQRGAPERRSCRDRSTVVSISLQVGHQLFERDDGPARGRCARGDRGGRQPPFPNAFGDQVVVAQQPPARLWRNDFGNNAIAIGNQHGFAGPSDAHILAKLVLESFEPDRTDGAKVASGSYFVKLAIFLFERTLCGDSGMPAFAGVTTTLTPQSR